MGALETFGAMTVYVVVPAVLAAAVFEWLRNQWRESRDRRRAVPGFPVQPATNRD